MTNLFTLVLLLYLTFHVVDKALDLLLKLSTPMFVDLWERLQKRLRHLDHPHGSKPFRFVCKNTEAELANEVYVAGSFNNWLNPEGALIRPYSWQKETYGLKKIVEGDQVRWEKEVYLMPGPHDFKFVVGKNLWIPWSSGSEYQRGNDAPGGPNMRVLIKA